jgi:hypothetical protein
MLKAAAIAHNAAVQVDAFSIEDYQQPTAVSEASRLLLRSHLGGKH